MERRWQLQEAKDRLSEVVDRALEEGPQVVTRHGKEVVVVVAKDEFDRRRGRVRRGTVLSFLRNLAFRGARLDVARSTDRGRKVEV